MGMNPATAPWADRRDLIALAATLEALIARPVYYELAERALAGDEQAPGLWSNGAFFPLTTSNAA